MNFMYLNIIPAYRNIFALADAELIGENFTEGKKILDIKESFYKGNKKTEEEVIELIRFHSKEDATFNIVGKKSISIALKENLIEEESIGRIDGIPYAMILI